MKLPILLLVFSIMSAAWAQSLDVQAQLDLNPEFRGTYVKVDQYQDLVILHGWAGSRRLSLDIEEAVRGMSGVTTIYNYMRFDEGGQSVYEIAAYARRVQVTASNGYDQVEDAVGEFDELPSFRGGELARNVYDRVVDDVIIGEIDLHVDSYNGLVILHGTVDDAETARRIQQVASTTPGTKLVYSYLTVVDPLPSVAVLDTNELFVVDLNPEYELRGTVPGAEPGPTYVSYEREPDQPDELDAVEIRGESTRPVELRCR